MARYKKYVVAEKTGKKIRIIRRKKGLSQEEAAAKTGIHVSTYGRIERGEINSPLQTINKIAQALGVRPSELLP